MSNNLKKIYCGIGKVPKTHRLGNMKECALKKQVRYWGIEKTDQKTLESAVKNKDGLPTTFNQAALIHAKYLGKKVAATRELKWAKNDEMKEKWKKELEDAEKNIKKYEKIAKELSKREKMEKEEKEKAKTVTKPVAKPSTKPAAKPSTVKKPAAKPVAKPAAKPAVKKPTATKTQSKK